MDSLRQSGSDDDNTFSTPIVNYLNIRLTTVEDSLPIKVSYLTNHLRDAYLSRLSALESRCARNRIFSFLVRRGISPKLLFLCFMICAGLAIRQVYRNSIYLVTHIVGVAFPTYKTLKALEEVNAYESEGGISDEIVQHSRDIQKQWLTYWVVYGSLQVVDNWAEHILEMFPMYNIAKIFVYYWAQNDRTRGATILYNRILRPIVNTRLKPKKVNGPVPTYRETSPILPPSAAFTSVPHHSDDDEHDSGFHDSDSDIRRLLNGGSVPQIDAHDLSFPRWRIDNVYH